MAYNNYFQSTYMPMQGARMPQIASQGSGQSILWVTGKEGAKAYPVAPGGNVLLMDSETNRFYIKSADASGMPMPLRIFSYTEEAAQVESKPEIDTTQFVTKEEFESFKESMKPKKGDKQ